MASQETITKADLANHLVENLALPKKDATLFVHAFQESIAKRFPE